MSAAVAAAAAASASAISGYNNSSSVDSNQSVELLQQQQQVSVAPTPPTLSRYESQKRRDWNTFGQYLKNHRPPLTLSRCSGAHVLEFLRYLDQFGKTKVHSETCVYFGNSHPPGPCPCPLKQAWGSLDALIGRLRAAFEENGGSPEMNPFGTRAVRLYLREVRDSQAKARGIPYEKKKRRKLPHTLQKQQNYGSLIMEDRIQGNDHLSSVQYSNSGYGGGGGGFVDDDHHQHNNHIHLSNSNGTVNYPGVVSYFSS